MVPSFYKGVIEMERLITANAGEIKLSNDDLIRYEAVLKPDEDDESKKVYTCTMYKSGASGVSVFHFWNGTYKSMDRVADVIEDDFRRRARQIYKGTKVEDIDDMIEEVDFLLSNKTQNKYPYIQLRDLLVQYFRKAVTEKSNIIGTVKKLLMPRQDTYPELILDKLLDIDNLQVEDEKESMLNLYRSLVLINMSENA